MSDDAKMDEVRKAVYDRFRQRVEGLDREPLLATTDAEEAFAVFAAVGAEDTVPIPRYRLQPPCSGHSKDWFITFAAFDTHMLVEVTRQVVTMDPKTIDARNAGYQLDRSEEDQKYARLRVQSASACYRAMKDRERAALAARITVEEECRWEVKKKNGW